MSWPCVREIRIDPVTGAHVPYVEINGVLRPAAWAAMPGSQCAALASNALVLLYYGAKGCGKTEMALVDWAQFCNSGLGGAHRGLWVRRTHPELADVIALSKTLIPKIVPGAIFIKQPIPKWECPNGEELMFSHILDESDVDRFQGFSLNWICMDEIVTWPNLGAFTFLLSLLRPTYPQATSHLRALTNPFGAASEDLRDYFKTPLPDGVDVGPIFRDEENPLITKQVIRGHISENLLLPVDYLQKVLAAYADDPAKQKAYAFGEWLEPSGSMYGHLLAQLKPVSAFDVPSPQNIRIGFDPGWGAPYSFLFFWIAAGEDIKARDGSTVRTRKGDVHVVGEIYGGSAKGNKGWEEPTAATIVRLKAFVEGHRWPLSLLRGSGNIADTSLWAEDGRPSVQSEYERARIQFEQADKTGGSRVRGVTRIRELLHAAIPNEHGERLLPGLFISEDCPNLWRHLLALRRDPKNPEDVQNEPSTVDHDHDALKMFLTREEPQNVFIGSLHTYNASRRLEPVR